MAKKTTSRPVVEITGPGCEYPITIEGFGATGTIIQPVDIEQVVNGHRVTSHSELRWEIRILPPEDR